MKSHHSLVSPTAIPTTAGSASSVTPPAKHAGGRPTTYTIERGHEFCRHLASGMTVRQVCEQIAGMPEKRAIYEWLTKYPEFAHAYARANELRADAMFEEMLEIADEGRNDTYIDEAGNEQTDYDVIARSKLRVDARKWALSKMNKSKYGDRVTNEMVGANGGPIEVTSPRQRLAEKLESLTPRLPKPSQ